MSNPQSQRRKEEKFARRIKFGRTQPISEAVDIRVTAQTIKIKKPFVKIERWVPNLLWTDPTFSWSNFANGATLPNGIQFLYNDEPEFDLPIKENHEFGRYGFDVDIEADTGGTQKNVLWGRLSYNKYSPSGFDMTDGNTFKIVIQDDLSARGDELTLVFQGFKWRK